MVERNRKIGREGYRFRRLRDSIEEHWQAAFQQRAFTPPSGVYSRVDEQRGSRGELVARTRSSTRAQKTDIAFGFVCIRGFAASSLVATALPTTVPLVYSSATFEIPAPVVTPRCLHNLLSNIGRKASWWGERTQSVEGPYSQPRLAGSLFLREVDSSGGVASRPV